MQYIKKQYLQQIEETFKNSSLDEKKTIILNLLKQMKEWFENLEIIFSKITQWIICDEESYNDIFSILIWSIYQAKDDILQGEIIQFENIWKCLSPVRDKELRERQEDEMKSIHLLQNFYS